MINSFSPPKPSSRRLLAVFAHPDDETFGPGGTLALYAHRGDKVHLICATRGELGEAPPDLNGFASIGEMRENELHRAALVLGLKAVHFLGYRDSGMPGSPDNQHPQALAAASLFEVAQQVAGYIREIRPQVIITFDPIGGYRHPDHIAIHRATVEAFSIAGDPSRVINGLPTYSPQKLYYSTFSRRLLGGVVRLLLWLGQDPHHFGKNRDIDLASLMESDFPIHARISIRQVLRQKEQASACHASQGGGFSGPLMWLQRWLGWSDTFMRAFPATPPPHMERDLFEGIES
ncbi:MAG: GlcNAc-PI de-N-acetylase [Chloroflexi bacterium GWB2_49_20]|nr:MAG: GlcNAc-PI de-N-acetylase [Chloroflexi bacterium GWB2_49_20]OGN79355.1 MAG: GlcNAc-PI de-N-acetylase [Chloroflexi bacterium GWC2_49_37]OGN82875.1 MAG: GlcNAc-PI de-N-acetylase [Chloroflexi bacterium GWD2_49_16]HCC78528.1 GlcNAc-PI de-N-acetylase [Anaerolineae bacterium]HCM97354.1 GlcNAc-PI de-N-acetylase [Anaerolineae bacterium]